MKHKPNRLLFSDLLDIVSEIAVIEDSLPPGEKCRLPFHGWIYSGICIRRWRMIGICDGKKIQVEIGMMCPEGSSSSVAMI